MTMNVLMSPSASDAFAKVAKGKNIVFPNILPLIRTNKELYDALAKVYVALHIELDGDIVTLFQSSDRNPTGADEDGDHCDNKRLGLFSKPIYPYDPDGEGLKPEIDYNEQLYKRIKLDSDYFDEFGFTVGAKDEWSL